MKRLVTLFVNGSAYEVGVPNDKRLVDVLRDELGLTGTKKGCGHGECGSCTVLIDGSPVNSCLVLAVQAEGKEITTIEGLGDGPVLHPLQEAFIRHGAIQCGYCTPGMLLTAKALLDRIPLPSEEEIRRAISGNFCRCTGYQKVVEAIMAVIRR